MQATKASRTRLRELVSVLLDHAGVRLLQLAMVATILLALETDDHSICDSLCSGSTFEHRPPFTDPGSLQHLI